MAMCLVASCTFHDGSWKALPKIIRRRESALDKILVPYFFTLKRSNDRRIN
jgi:hypothetical protein